VIGAYKTPIMGLGEIALVAAIGFHALNGLRIILIDFWSGRHQASPSACSGLVIVLWIVPPRSRFVPRHLMHVFGG
jgi:succinate dehydrogenase / fumarate reductase cytochrome b subunit